MKRKHEHAVRVQEIQSLLENWSGSDLTTFGELIAEGSFRMRGAKAPRHVFLFDKMLLLAKKREYGHLIYKAHIMVSLLKFHVLIKKNDYLMTQVFFVFFFFNLQCSNLTLMESIPGEPLSFNVIPFDNSQIQYTLQVCKKCSIVLYSILYFLLFNRLNILRL